MIGFWIVESFTGAKDAAGYDTAAWCASKMDMSLKATLYLPPYLRKSQCGIGEGDCVFGISDDVTGLGAALFGEGGADFQYFFDANIEIKKSLTVDKSAQIKDKLDVTNNIKSAAGDVVATTVSLKTHTHAVTSLPCVPPPPATTPIGTVSGTTSAPV